MKQCGHVRIIICKYLIGKSTFSFAKMKSFGVLPLSGSVISFANNGPQIAQHPQRCAPVLLPERESELIIKAGLS